MNYELIVGVVLSFAVTAFCTRFFANKFKQWGITGRDVHKPDRPLRAEMGGVGILIGFAVVAVLSSIFGLTMENTLAAGILTIIIVGLIGIVDDLFGLRQIYKTFLVAAATIPMVLVYGGKGEIWFPIIGFISFGLVYPFFIIPLAVTTSANFSNILAGFNGLEAGIGAIALGSLGLLSLSYGLGNIAWIAFVLSAAFCAFLIYNRFPAKIFPGDSGTLVSGAAIAVVGLLGRLEFAAIAVSIPAAFDFTLKSLNKKPFSQRKIFGDTLVRQDGYLEPAPYPSLPHAFAKVASVSEKSLVGMLLLMEGLYSAFAVSVTLLLH